MSSLGNFLIAQSSETVQFYYAVDNDVRIGSVRLTYSLQQNGSNLGFSDIVDQRITNPSDLKLIVHIDNLRWAEKAHNKRFKLLFGNELLEVSPGLSEDISGKIYIRYNTPTKEISCSIDAVEELTTGVLFIGFIIADIDATYDEAFNDDGAARKKLGAGASMKAITLVPKYYKEDEAGEIEFNTSLQNILFDGLNESIKQMFYEMALNYSQGNFTALDPEAILKKMRNRNFNPNTSGFEIQENLENPTLPPSYPNIEYSRFQEAQRIGTIDAYRDYLNAYPNGEYQQAANTEILNQTAFRLQQEQMTDGLFTVHTIRFTAGVGNRPPAFEMTQNDDWAIEGRFDGPSTFVLRLPPERRTDITFRLGRKDTTLTLLNETVVQSTAVMTEPKETTITSSHNIPNKPKKQNKSWMAVLLAIPFLAVITFLLYRKYATI